MLKGSAARIVSARKRVILAVLAVAIFAIGIGAYVFGAPRDDGSQKSWQPPTDGSSTDDQPAASVTYVNLPVTAGAKTHQLQLADTSDKQSLGLGKRKTIGGDGMIFPYSKPQRLCFWMKDMNFSIDMIWLDNDKRVSKIEPDVSPDTYPRKTYCVDDARYVVELGDGEAAKSGIKTGDILSFSL